MKSKINLYNILIVSILILSSCSKSYLDKTPFTSNDLTAAISSEADLGVAVNGMYASLRATDYTDDPFLLKVI